MQRKTLNRTESKQDHLPKNGMGNGQMRSLATELKTCQNCQREANYTTFQRNAQSTFQKDYYGELVQLHRSIASYFCTLGKAHEGALFQAWESWGRVCQASLTCCTVGSPHFDGCCCYWDMGSGCCGTGSPHIDCAPSKLAPRASAVLAKSWVYSYDSNLGLWTLNYFQLLANPHGKMDFERVECRSTLFKRGVLLWGRNWPSLYINRRYRRKGAWGAMPSLKYV